MVNILCGDCLQGMPEVVADKSIDLVVCDLPYGVTANKSDIVIPFEPLWEQYERVVKDSGAILLFAQGMFYVDLVNSNRKLFKYDLVWDKVLSTGFLNANRCPLRLHEQIAVFYKEQPTYNPQFEIGEPNHSRGYSKAPKSNNNYGDFVVVEPTQEDEYKKFPKSIITFQKPHPSVAKHRTEKPVELLEYLIKTYSNAGDLVLDNCMGSGTTGVAAVNTDRDFIGFELDEHYFSVAKDRIEKAQYKRDRKLW